MRVYEERPLAQKALYLRLDFHEIGAVRFHLDRTTLARISLDCLGFTRTRCHPRTVQFQIRSLSQVNPYKDKGADLVWTCQVPDKCKVYPTIFVRAPNMAYVLILHILPWLETLSTGRKLNKNTESFVYFIDSQHPFFWIH